MTMTQNTNPILIQKIASEKAEISSSFTKGRKGSGCCRMGTHADLQISPMLTNSTYQTIRRKQMVDEVYIVQDSHAGP